MNFDVLDKEGNKYEPTYFNVNHNAGSRFLTYSFPHKNLTGFAGTYRLFHREIVMFKNICLITNRQSDIKIEIPSTEKQETTETKK